MATKITSLKTVRQQKLERNSLVVLRFVAKTAETYAALQLKRR